MWSRLNDEHPARQAHANAAPMPRPRLRMLVPSLMAAAMELRGLPGQELQGRGCSRSKGARCRCVHACSSLVTRRGGKPPRTAHRLDDPRFASAIRWILVEQRGRACDDARSCSLRVGQKRAERAGLRWMKVRHCTIASRPVDRIPTAADRSTCTRISLATGANTTCSPLPRATQCP